MWLLFVKVKSKYLAIHTHIYLLWALYTYVAIGKKTSSPNIYWFTLASLNFVGSFKSQTKMQIYRYLLNGLSLKWRPWEFCVYIHLCWLTPTWPTFADAQLTNNCTRSITSCNHQLNVWPFCSFAMQLMANCMQLKSWPSTVSNSVLSLSYWSASLSSLFCMLRVPVSRLAPFPVILSRLHLASH